MNSSTDAEHQIREIISPQTMSLNPIKSPLQSLTRMMHGFVIFSLQWIQWAVTCIKIGKEYPYKGACDTDKLSKMVGSQKPAKSNIQWCPRRLLLALHRCYVYFASAEMWLCCWYWIHAEYHYSQLCGDFQLVGCLSRPTRPLEDVWRAQKQTTVKADQAIFGSDVYWQWKLIHVAI